MVTELTMFSTPVPTYTKPLNAYALAFSRQFIKYEHSGKNYARNKFLYRTYVLLALKWLHVNFYFSCNIHPYFIGLHQGNIGCDSIRGVQWIFKVAHSYICNNCCSLHMYMKYSEIIVTGNLEQNVFRLDVAMEDAVLVQVIEALQQLIDVALHADLHQQTSANAFSLLEYLTLAWSTLSCHNLYSLRGQNWLITLFCSASGRTGSFPSARRSGSPCRATDR